MERAVDQSVDVGVARSSRRRRRRRRRAIYRFRLDGVVVEGREEDFTVEVVVGTGRRRSVEALGGVRVNG